MKDALKRAAQALGFTAVPAQAETEEIKTEASVAEVVEAEAPEVVTTLADGTELITHTFEAPATASSYHQVVDELSRANHKIDEQATALTAIASELADLKAANAQAAAAALVAKMEARQAAVVAALGTERASAFMAATKDMPDAQFSTVMAAMTASTTAEASSALFVEKGVDAQADVDALQAEAGTNGTAAILKAKYQRPAAN